MKYLLALLLLPGAVSAQTKTIPQRVDLVMRLMRTGGYDGNRLQYVFEPGGFKVYIGGNSRDVKEAAFTLERQ